MNPDVIAGLDLGRFNDRSVLSTGRIDFDNIVLTGVHELPPVSWDEQVARIAKLTRGVGTLAVDRTGIGQPVSERLQRELPCTVVPVNFDRKTKQQLCERLIEAVSTKRLSVEQGCPGALLLKEQMGRFTMTPTRTGMRYSGKASGRDDAVIATALMVSAATTPQGMRRAH